MTETERFDVRCAACWDLFQRGDLLAARDLALLAITDGVPQHPQLATSAHVCAASSAGMLGDLDAALEIFAEGERVAHEHSNPEHELSALTAARALMFSAHDRLDEAQRDAQQALVLARRTRNPTVLTLASMALGWALSASDPEASRAAYEESIALSESGALGGGLSVALAHVAPLRLQAGDAPGAIDALLASITHCREIGERLSVVAALDSLVVVLTELGETEVPVVTAGVIHAEVFGPAIVIGSPESRERRERCVALARDALGSAAYEAALARGAAMSDEEALAYTLTELDRVRTTLVDA
jgi:tetratricopeptide (TPR) repeat protein